MFACNEIWTGFSLAQGLCFRVIASKCIIKHVSSTLHFCVLIMILNKNYLPVIIVSHLQIYFKLACF